jgi:3-deoxy-D-manno-octulosonate 8-phosphate phosphatase KdsC-like HAD superfamily phosphatase
LDADGVFFTGHEHRTIIDGKVSISKTRHFIDGQGISFLRELGIKIVFVTGEGEPLESIVLKINEIPSAKSGRWAPVEMLLNKTAKEKKLLVSENGY